MSPGAPEFGGGRKSNSFVIGAATEGITFTWPPLEIALRPVPSGLPVDGSKTIPAWAGTSVPSIVWTMTGACSPEHGVGDVVIDGRVASVQM